MSDRMGDVDHTSKAAVARSFERGGDEPDTV
jgi:hypothetical protein